jgi:hypothetical protein
VAKPAWAYLKSQLQRNGIDVVDDVTWSASSFSNDALKFRRDGVTHLFLDTFAGLFYPPQAQNQQYFARYAVTTHNVLQPLVQGTAPSAQLRGMMGVGWVPAQDVDLAHNPGPNAGQTTCLNIMRQEGADLSKQNYQYVAEANCDRMFLFLQMAKTGDGLLPSNLLSGVRSLGSDFAWASQLGESAATTNPISMAPGVRFLQYVQSCNCVQYAGSYVKVP